MNNRKGAVAAEFIARLKAKGFFIRFCHMVCPDAEKEICPTNKEICPYTNDEIMEFWYEAADKEEDHSKY